MHTGMLDTASLGPARNTQDVFYDLSAALSGHIATVHNGQHTPHDSIQELVPAAAMLLQYVLEQPPADGAADVSAPASKKRAAADEAGSQDENTAPSPAKKKKASTVKAEKPAKPPAPKVRPQSPQTLWLTAALSHIQQLSHSVVLLPF
jgi:hypothetical protein